MTTIQWGGRANAAHPPGVSPPGGQPLPAAVLGALVADKDLPGMLADQDAWGLLLRLASLMCEAGDHPGAWCVDAPLDNIRAAVRAGGTGWGPDRFLKALELLQTKKVIWREKARGGGVGRGAINGRIWATWDPVNLVIPPHVPTPPGGRIIVDTPLTQTPVSTNSRGATSGKANSDSRTSGNRRLLPIGQNDPLHEGTGGGQLPGIRNPGAQIHDDDSDHHLDTQEPDVAPQAPADQPISHTYRQLLASVGWLGKPPAGDHLINELVLRHMLQSGRWRFTPDGRGGPGPTFRSWIAAGGDEVIAYARRSGIPIPGVEAATPVGPMMPMKQWVRLSVEHPDWARAVKATARATSPEGAELTVNRYRAVALTVPLPDEPETTGGVGTA